LYQSSKSNISEHISHIFAEGELVRDSVVRKFRTTASDGKAYHQKYYDLQAVIAVGFKVNSESAIQFRVWAGNALTGLTFNGYMLDKEAPEERGGVLQRLFRPFTGGYP